MMKRLFVLLALCYLDGFAQDSVSATRPTITLRNTISVGSQPGYTSSVTGAPYCAEVLSGNVQTLADGTHITLNSPPIKVCRDSMGRTRQERAIFQGVARTYPGPPDTPVIIEITDPVAHVRYVLEPQAKVAHKQPLSAPNRPTLRKSGGAGGPGPAPLPNNLPAARLEPAPAADPKGPQTVTEKLEPQIIEGVLAEGKRTTTTWPEGSRMGNDRPITSVVESWHSPELQIPLLVKTYDPRSGEHTDKVANLTRSEPDPSMFQLPPDYSVVDETGDLGLPN